MLPQRIGKYEIVGKLGQGAMGEVFRAHDPVLNRAVAIKRISAGLDADDMVRKRFQREAQSAALLSHPNIITVYELGIEGDQLFMAMELLDGIDLKHAFARGQMTFEQKLDVMEQICEGLAFAHAHDVVHRDLKPANIHLLPGTKVKIMDFGLARMSGSDMTSTGTVMGTPHYMSPEQVRGVRADARSDVFALGCVFYEALCGKKPFDAESMHAVLFKVMQEEPTPLAEVTPGLPPVIVQVVDRALAKDAAQRFQSAGEMLAALRRARQAAATGRGHERVADLDRTAATAAPPATPTAPVARHAVRPAERSPDARAGSRPPARDESRRVLVLGLVAALVAVALGAWGLRTWVLGRPAPSPQPTGVASLAADVIDTLVKLARRRLEVGDYADAARQAEKALTLDATNAEARAVFDEASALLARIEGARQALRSAPAGTESAARAAFELMELDPSSPEAESAATAAGAAFRKYVEEAERLATGAKAAAETAGGRSLPSFADGVSAEGQAQRALQGGLLAEAARRYVQARQGFDRARPGGR